MIQFEKLTIEGFGSIVKPLEFNLNQEGLNVIRGRVGSGKTTIPSALSWCLFGQSLKEKSQIRTWEELRTKDFKGTKVEVEFIKGNHKYQIIRCEAYKGYVVGKQRGSSKLYILRDGEDVVNIDEKPYNEIKGKKDQQAVIEKILGYSFDLFKSSIIFGQKMKRIIEETGPQKKKIFEEAFDAGFIEDARNNEKEELAKLEDAKDDLEDKVLDLQEKVEERKELLEEALEDEANFEKEKKIAIRELREEVLEYETEIEKIKKEEYKGSTKRVDKLIRDLEATINSASVTNAKYDSLKRQIRETKNKLKKKKKELKQPVHICPTCGNEMNKVVTKRYKKQLRIDISDLSSKITQLKEERKGIEKIDTVEKQTLVKELRRERDIINSKIIQSRERKKSLPRLIEKSHQLRRNIRKLESKKLKIRSNIHKTKIEELEKKTGKLKRQIKQLSKEIEIKKWLIRDPLSNSGIKAYIFDNLLADVNIRLEEYSRILGFKVEFGIDLQSKNKDFYQAILKDDIIIPYQDLSGGQKQLVDTSIAFAIHDVISSIRPTNIIFLDEPFESLGDEEIELIEELIENKSKNKTLFLITHHKSFNPRNANEIIFKLNKEKHTMII